MATTVMSSRAVQSTVNIPSHNTLLPPDGSTTHPPIFLKLNASILDLFASAEPPSKINLLITDRSAVLRVDDKEFQGAQYKEPGHVEVYLKEHKGSENQFRNIGEIKSRILIKSEKFTNVAVEREQTELTHPIEAKVIQLLSVKAHSAKALSTKTQASLNLVNSILQKVAEPQSGNLFMLKKEYEARKDSSKDLARGSYSAQSNVDTKEQRHKDSSQLPLKKGGIAGGKGLEKDVEGKTPAVQSKADTKKHVRRDAKRDTKSDESKLNMDAQQPPQKTDTAISATKRKPNQLTESSKRVKRADESTAMFELARKFQNAYGEYLELYSLLSKHKSRSPSQVQKLMAMHTQLAQWKKTLWSNARSKSQVK